MNLYLQNERKTARRRLIGATVVVIFLLSIDILTGGYVRSIVRSAAGVVLNAGSSTSSFLQASGVLSSRRALQIENNSLREELTQLQLRLAEYRVLKDENVELREIARLVEDATGISAPILSTTHSSPYGTFLLGAGTSDGVAEGDMVMTGADGGLVIGEIVSAHEHQSLVKEVFAPGASVEGIIDGANLIFKGQGGGNARAEAPRTLQIEVGDPVISPLFGGRLIGTVGAVSSDPASAYTSVYVRVPIGLSQLKFLHVASPSK